MPYFLSAPRLWYSQYAIKKIKNAASKIAIIQYRILPEDFFAQRKGFAAWQ